MFARQRPILADIVRPQDLLNLPSFSAVAKTLVGQHCPIHQSCVFTLPDHYILTLGEDSWDMDSYIEGASWQQKGISLSIPIRPKPHHKNKTKQFSLMFNITCDL